MIGFNYAPRDWAFCDGTILPITQHEALYSLISTTYGGDGRNTFGLPDLRGRVPMHSGQGPGLTSRQPGQFFGTEMEQLQISQIPSHNHDILTSAPAASVIVEDQFVSVGAPVANVNVGNDFVTASAPTANVNIDSDFVTVQMNAAFVSANEVAPAPNRGLASPAGAIYSPNDATLDTPIAGITVATKPSAFSVTFDSPAITVDPSKLTVTNQPPTVAVDSNYIAVTVDKPAAVAQDTGGGLPHDNIQPSLVVNFIIALDGLYPPRS